MHQWIGFKKDTNLQNASGKAAFGKHLRRWSLPAGFVLAASGLLWAAANAAYLQSRDRSPDCFNSTLLVQKNLKGSMQGRSGAALDLNNDTLEDLVIGAPYAQYQGGQGALLVYHSTPRGFTDRPVSILAGKGNLGWSLVTLKGAKRNGPISFAAGAVTGSGPQVSLAGTVTVYEGRLHPHPVLVLEGEQALDRFGFTLASADLNGDGEADLVVGAPLHSPGPDLYQQGAVYVYFGPRFREAERIRIPATAAYGGLGLCLAAGDINGDGLADLLLGATGQVVGFYGPLNPASRPTIPDVIIKGADGGFGRSLAVLWDVDQDGFNDMAVGAYQAVVNGVNDTGRLFIVQGGAGKREVNTATAALARIAGELHSGQFGSAILNVTGKEGDRILAVSAVHADGATRPMTGKIYLFAPQDLETQAGVDSVRNFPGTARDMHLGTFLSAGQGRQGQWLAAGAPTELENTGSVRLFNLSEPAGFYPGRRGKGVH